MIYNWRFSILLNLQSTMDLNGVVAFITGGVSGIGLATAKELLGEGAKNVALLDINEEAGERVIEELNNEFGEDKAIFLKVDVCDLAALEDALKETIERFDTVDIIFNNAGIGNEVNWEKVIDINFKAVVAGTHLAHKYIGKQNGGKGGTVINTASITALEPFISIPVYSSTKSGVMGVGRAFGAPFQFERSDIRLLTIYPGLTDTNIIPSLTMFDEEAEKHKGEDLARSPFQAPEELAKHLINILKTAENGTHWLIEGNRCWSLKLPTQDELEKTELLL